MRILLLALTACRVADAASPQHELFPDRMQVRMACWRGAERAADAVCAVTTTRSIAGARVVRLDCDHAAVSDGWFVIEHGVGVWQLGWGTDHDQPLLPTFGWQSERAFDTGVLEMLHLDGPDFTENPAPRAWDAWQNDDYALGHVRRPNGASWCTSTQRDSTRWDLCIAGGELTGASSLDTYHSESFVHCGDAPPPITEEALARVPHTRTTPDTGRSW